MTNNNWHITWKTTSLAVNLPIISPVLPTISMLCNLLSISPLNGFMGIEKNHVYDDTRSCFLYYGWAYLSKNKFIFKEGMNCGERWKDKLGGNGQQFWEKLKMLKRKIGWTYTQFTFSLEPVITPCTSILFLVVVLFVSSLYTAFSSFWLRNLLTRNGRGKKVE